LATGKGLPQAAVMEENPTFLAQLLPSAQPFAHIRRSRCSIDQ